MRIVLYECKKAFTSPILVSLFVLFAGYNFFFIWSGNDSVQDQQPLLEIADQYGVTITNEAMNGLEKELSDELLHLNERQNEASFTSGEAFFQELSYAGPDTYGESEISEWSSLYIKESYLADARMLDGLYREIDIYALGQGEIERYGLSGEAAAMLTEQYETFSLRFDELVEQREHLHWFFNGKQLFMHSALFKSVFSTVMIESILLIVLATALIANYEFEQRSHLVTYTSKRGRRLMLNKLAASLLSSFLIAALLLSFTLAVFFAVNDYTGLFATSINSGFNWEGNFPNVSWWNLTVGEYLFLSLLVFFGCIIVLSLMTFTISQVCHNSYGTFFLFAGCFILLFLIPGYIPTDSTLLFITSFNPSSLALNSSSWFMATKGLLVFEQYELLTLASWTTGLLMICYLLFRRFTKQAIV